MPSPPSACHDGSAIAIAIAVTSGSGRDGGGGSTSHQMHVSRQTKAALLGDGSRGLHEDELELELGAVLEY